MRPLVVCDLAHSLCTVKFEKEDVPLLTNYLYFGRLLSVSSSTKERKSKVDVL